MDDKKSIRISNVCDCTIHISLRNIIEIGLKPVIRNITTDIAASLRNNELFGNYIVKSLFIIGNMFTLSYKSPIYTAYAMILQKEIDLSIELKERDTQGFVLRQDLCRLLQPNLGKKPYMCDSFVIGNLNQVSKETYIIYAEPNGFLSSVTPKKKTSAKSKDDETIFLGNEDAAIVILQKGQLIPNKGISKRFKYDNNQAMSLKLGNMLRF
jgi:hypothetical protein